MTSLNRPQPVGMIGGGTCTPGQYEAAYQVANGLAAAGLAVMCGGRGGVMEAACKGTQDADGLAIAVLPGTDPGEANAYATVVLATGFGNRDEAIAAGRPDFSRNRIIVSTASCLVAVGGSKGTANELKLALQFGKMIFGLEGTSEPEDAATIDQEVRRRLLSPNGWAR